MAIVNGRETARRWRLALVGMTKQAAVLQFNSVPDAGEQLKTLGHDDHPNVGNLIGYSYRKPGDYKFSQVWYERGLKVDPNHVLTWQYYGLCQIEQGNRDQTHEIAERLASLPGHSFSFERCTVGFRNPYRPCRHPQACRRLRSSSALRPPWLRW